MKATQTICVLLNAIIPLAAAHPVDDAHVNAWYTPKPAQPTKRQFITLVPAPTTFPPIAEPSVVGPGAGDEEDNSGGETGFPEDEEDGSSSNPGTNTEFSDPEASRDLAIELGQELIDAIHTEIESGGTSATYLGKDEYDSAANATGMTFEAMARTRTGLPVGEDAQTKEFFTRVTGERPLGEEARATLWVHEVSLDLEAFDEGPSIVGSDPVFAVCVTANKGGALAMVDYNREVLEAASQSAEADPILLHQHIGAAVEGYGETGNPFQIKFLVASGDVLGEVDFLVLDRVAANEDLRDGDGQNQYMLSVDGAGAEGESFRELAATFLGANVFNAMAAYHEAFGDWVPLKAHILYNGESQEDGSNYVIWELGEIGGEE